MNRIKPMTELLHKDQWSKACQQSFEEARKLLMSSSVLTHFDPQLPICVMHLHGVGVNYSQIEKEALGIIFGVQKFRDCLYDRKFLVITDQQPLVKILGLKI